MSSGDGDERQKCSKEDTEFDDTSSRCHGGVCAAHETESDGDGEWGGVASRVGSTGYTCGAVGAARMQAQCRYSCHMHS